jgi:hypothetical protein
MELDPRDLDKISAVTLQHYDAQAEDFRDGTYDLDGAERFVEMAGARRAAEIAIERETLSTLARMPAGPRHRLQECEGNQRARSDPRLAPPQPSQM